MDALHLFDRSLPLRHGQGVQVSHTRTCVTLPGREESVGPLIIRT